MSVSKLWLSPNKKSSKKLLEYVCGLFYRLCMNEINVEEIRGWVNEKKGAWKRLADDTGLSYHTIQKFAQGRIVEPRLAKLNALAEVMRSEISSHG